MYLNVYIPFTPNKLEQHSMLKKRAVRKTTKQEANLCMEKIRIGKSLPEYMQKTARMPVKKKKVYVLFTYLLIN